MNLDIGGVRKEFVVSTERRGTSRFPLREEVRYRVLHARTNHVSGVGKTLNIGSGGMLFTTEEDLPIGRMVEISVNWPARLDGTCPLKFVATGRVVRSANHQTAVKIERYEFRTRGAAMSLAG
jgi:PilZ domain